MAYLPSSKRALNHDAMNKDKVGTGERVSASVSQTTDSLDFDDPSRIINES